MQSLSGQQVDRYLSWSAGLAWLVAGVDLVAWLARVAGIDLPITWRTGVDALLFAVLAYGIGRRSRVAAVSLVLYWVVTKWALWLEYRRVGALIGLVVFGYVFVQGARAVFQAHANRLAVAASSDPAT
jgi:hypothetical protein